MCQTSWKTIAKLLFTGAAFCCFQVHLLQSSDWLRHLLITAYLLVWSDLHLGFLPMVVNILFLFSGLFKILCLRTTVNKYLPPF